MVLNGLRDILKIVAMLSGNVSIRLTPELQWNGNSVAECLSEKQVVVGSNPTRSTRISSHYTGGKCTIGEIGSIGRLVRVKSEPVMGRPLIIDQKGRVKTKYLL